MLKSKFAHFQLFHYLPGWGVGGWGKAENKAKLSPAGAGSWAELGNYTTACSGSLTNPICEYQVHETDILKLI